MWRTNIYLDDDQLRALRHVAAEEQESVAALVRRAVDRLLAERLQGDADWTERFEALVARIQFRIPPDVSPDQIEADITAARKEVRQAHQAASAKQAGAARAGGR